MPDIHIQRDHQLGRAAARQVALAWADKATQKLHVEWRYEEGDEEDTLYFERSGVDGKLRVDGSTFAIDIQLGFLMGVFKDEITQQINRQFDKLLGVDAEQPPTQA